MPASGRFIPTTGEIARRLGIPNHRIEYVIRARGIRHRGWAGNARVFSEEDVIRITDEINRIQKARSTRG